MLISRALNGLHYNVLLGLIIISNTGSKRLGSMKVYQHVAHSTNKISIYMQIFMFVSASVSIIMLFLGQITISNTRSKRACRGIISIETEDAVASSLFADVMNIN